MSEPVAVMLEEPPAPAKPWRRKFALRGAGWIVIAAVLVLSFIAGIQLRHWVFQATDPIRFVADIRRGCYWGLAASGPEGYLNQYDKMQDELPDRIDARWVPWLDYAPLRLAVMDAWGHWQWKNMPPPGNVPSLDAWQHSYEFNRVPLLFNTALELFACFCAFWLTRHWVIRSNAGVPRHHFDGIWQGVVAAVLLWFCPDILLSAHGWITWDSWIVPWFLCTALLASLDWWFAAGVAMGIGAMFKAQQLTVAPIFLLWPILQWRFGAALRWITGVVFAIGMIASGWMLTYLSPADLQHARSVQERMDVASYPPDLFVLHRHFDFPAAIWIGEIILLAIALPRVMPLLAEIEKPADAPKWRDTLHSHWIWAVAIVVFVIAIVSWPMLIHGNRAYLWIGILGGAILAAAAAIGLKPKNQLYVLAGAVGSSLLLCMLLFHGGVGWAKCTFEYGTVHWPYMVQGLTDNVPGFFEIRFGWPHEASETAFTLPAIARHWPHWIAARGWWPAYDADVSAKTLFDSIYAFFLLISAVGVALQARWKDRRMLVALTTPWIMFFLWPVQIHERYLLFAAGVGVCCIGNSVGTCLLALMLTAASTVMHLDVMMDQSPAGVVPFGENLSKAMPWLFSQDSGDTIRNYVSAMHPDLAWGILILSLAFLYLSLTRSPRWRD
jgi:hypothetical protein